jgi:hypothetical protein
MVTPDVHASANRLNTALVAVCDAAMPKAKSLPGKRQVYWWSTDIAELRSACSTARRAYTRSRRRSARDSIREDQLYDIYKEAKKSLQLAISRAKSASWNEIIQDLDRNPWSRTYKAARNKLRTQSIPITESLQPEFLSEVIDELFPNCPEHITPDMVSPARNDVDLSDVPNVTEAELGRQIDRLKTKKTAPGPDGIPAQVLGIALKHLGERLRQLFDECLKSRQFPKPWKAGKLCLIQKPDRSPDTSAAYRPIVLLDEVGKVLERVLATRIVQHLEDIGPNLSAAQYGFRPRKSTIDALAELRKLTADAFDKGEVVLAVSLDIRNAFNSLPFATIKEALRYHKLPLYMRGL